MRKLKRPLIIVPSGLKDWFMKEVTDNGLTLLHEIREIDPTRPGHDEFEELVKGDFEPETPPPYIRLVYSKGRTLDR